ncbi:hypothetical protein [Pseudoalteromonas tetraodonis]|uniref:hypothetical protein n=1 Tax=Pseudoalteromonas tetraodonis TaxID=43659 RepID=UPI003A970CDA
MNGVTQLGQHKFNKQQTRLLGAVKALIEDELPTFKSMQDNKTLIGEWDDFYWTYQNKNIYFTKRYDNTGELVTGKTPVEARVPMDDIWCDIAKLYTLIHIKKGKANKSIVASIAGCFWLADHFNYDLDSIITLKQADIDELPSTLDKHFAKRSVFEKYKETVAFVKTFLVPKKLCPSFAPKVKLANPANKQNDVTTEEYQKRRDKKFNVNIDKYIGIAKRRFEADQPLISKGEEPAYPVMKSGYDELRFLAIPFFMAFGLRIGEVCRLHKDCIGFDETNERWYLRVLTEKGELASARPVPLMWQEIILESHKRILEITAPFRALAKSIEQHREQAVINVLHFPDRDEYFSTALQEAGYKPSSYFLRSEVGKTGEFHTSGLGFNNLREKAPYADAIVDKVTIKTSPNTPKNLKVVISKEALSEIAMQRYNDMQKQVYESNDDGEDITEEIVSTSYAFKMPFSDFLFIAKEDTFDGGSNSHGFLPLPMRPKSFTRWLKKDSSRAKSLFQRYDVRDEDGNIVNVESHQFRHWLTDAMKRSGKNEMMIDLFMGRTAGQTRNYDHRTAKERAEEIRERYLSEDSIPDDVLGRRIKRMRENNVSLDEIEMALSHTLSVVHFTPWGTCNRDLDVSPCEKGMMCLRSNDGDACQHFGIDPNDEEAKASIINTKTHYENQLSVLLPNYQELSEALNKQEPLDQHVQYCIDTIKGCENALKAYERQRSNNDQLIDIVQVYTPEVNDE